MKIKTVQKIHSESGPNMTPLVDIVMVILIFLMLCGSFGTSEKYVESILQLRPHGSNPYRPANDFAIDLHIDPYINSNGKSDWQVSFNSYIGGKAIKGDIAELKAALQSTLTKTTANQISPDHLQVMIAPGQNVKWQWVTTIYTAALESGYKRISFANRI